MSPFNLQLGHKTEDCPVGRWEGEGDGEMHFCLFRMRDISATSEIHQLSHILGAIQGKEAERGDVQKSKSQLLKTQEAFDHMESSGIKTNTRNLKEEEKIYCV